MAAGFYKPKKGELAIKVMRKKGERVGFFSLKKRGFSFRQNTRQKGEVKGLVAGGN